MTAGYPDMLMNEDLLQRLRLCSTLPTPPATALRVIDLANNPATSLMQIADCVALDPALAAKMLKVANSPLYNVRRSATNVRQAVNLIGMHAAISIALSFILVRSLKAVEPGKEDTLFWRRSVLSALASRVLAKRFGLKPDDLLLAGLLQDIGILALRTAMPDEYAQVAACAFDHDALLKAEQENFGSGHDEVGYWILKKWKLPDYLALACLTSHSAPSASTGTPSIGSCVAVSGYLADVFIKAGDAVSTLKANNAVHRWLGMESDALVEIIQDMNTGVAELETLFDLPLIAEDEAEALVAEAKELILVANLGRLRELEETAQRDALTGAHNRLYFNSAIEQEFAASSRHGWPMSVAFIDIDHFKRINDHYGHAIGDIALVTVSRLISVQIRNGDVFARYGGEEFVLIFPGTQLEPALKVVNRIRETIASFSHTLDTDETFNLTISVGLACHAEGESTYESADHMLRAADEALYGAKRLGRNQVAMASPGSPHTR